MDVYDIYPSKILFPLDAPDDIIDAYRAKNKKLQTHHCISQPGLRYAQADILRRLLQQEMEIQKFSLDETTVVLNLYDNTVFGIMLEEVLMHEIMLACRKASGIPLWEKDWNTNLTMQIRPMKVSSPQDDFSSSSKEIDIVIVDGRRGINEYYLYEVKHSHTINDNQRKWLFDSDI